MIRTFDARSFDARALASAKAGRTVGVIIPARDEETTIGGIVEAIVRDCVETSGLVDEVVVVDDRSADRTRAVAEAAGARVVSSRDVLPELGPARGKGGALWKGVAASTGDLLAFVDGDVRDFDTRFVVGLVGPLLEPDAGIAFVKGFYQRTLDGQPRGGGRVTELAARPAISILLPHLSPIVQPLAGEFAAPRSTLEQLPFVEGYGVDVALLADAAARFGVDALAQVDLGLRVHRNRPLHELGPMATEVLLAAMSRAGVDVPSSAVLRAPDATTTLDHAERPPLLEVEAYRRGRTSGV